MRSVPEWIGKTDDAMPPASVRQRILDRAGKLCHLCGGAISKPGWHADHVKPIIDGGENRETNLKPAHGPCHRKETARQAIERAPIERQKLKHSGAKRPKGFNNGPKPEKVSKKLSLTPRKLFTPGGIWPTGNSFEGEIEP